MIMNKIIGALICGVFVCLLTTSVRAKEYSNTSNESSKSFQIADTALDKKPEKHSLKTMKKAAKKSSSQWFARKSADISEDFDEAVYKIGKSSLPQEVKNLLLSQAKEDKDLALKQAKETSELLEKQQNRREKYSQILNENKHSKKIIKKIDDIVK